MDLAARLARDHQFAAAALAAPAVWLAMHAFAQPGADPSWVLRDPLRFASLVFAWPLLEELVFRGAIQPALLRKRWGEREAFGVSTANVATSLLFAGAHLATHSPEWAAATLFPSLAFGYFRDRYQSLVPGTALHVLYNFGWFLLAGA